MTPAVCPLDDAFPQPFASFGRTLRLPERDAVPLPDLLRPAALAEVTARYALRFPGGERRAVLSFWVQHYLLALIPAAAAAALVARQDLPVALDGMAAVLSAEAQPTALCLPHPGCAAAASCPALRLAPLLRTHLEPLAQALAAAGLPPLILWGNAGAVLTWTLGVVTAPACQVAAVRQWLEADRWADGAANPFRPALSRGACGLARRVCCLRYRLLGVAACPDCPRSRNVRGEARPGPAAG